MSSGFVSGGTTEKPIERDDAWLQAQKDIEQTRRKKEEESRQEGGKTLYEVLQQNKGGCLHTTRLSNVLPMGLLTCQVRCDSPSRQAGSFRRIHTVEKPVSKFGRRRD